ncbi:hypothetical protein NDU88_005607 [Pleurodeles waltl]|uniref:Uncharacterized protein n=1 Tax=Pleurodeles waltl TaxID=8319 RepID=A0AAV7LN48_PLEWA|nr:hypothetical protein NDU88_005607 [Pleurodeles waltl]
MVYDGSNAEGFLGRCSGSPEGFPTGLDTATECRPPGNIAKNTWSEHRGDGGLQDRPEEKALEVVVMLKACRMSPTTDDMEDVDFRLESELSMDAPMDSAAPIPVDTLATADELIWR